MLTYHDTLLLLPLLTSEILAAQASVNELVGEKVSRNLAVEYLDRLRSIQEVILKGP